MLPPKELPGVPPSAGESVPAGTKICRLIFLFTIHADFVLLQARDPIEAIRLRATRLKVVRRGKLLAQTPAATAKLHLAGRPGQTSLMHGRE